FELFFEGDPLTEAHEKDMSRLASDMQISRARFANRYLSTDDVIADISCGSGYLSELLRFKTYYGVDHPEMVAMIADSGMHQRSSVVFVPHDFEDGTDLSLSEEMDKIVSFETIEHLEDPERFLHNIGRNLRTGGQLILSTPNNPFNDPPRYSYHVREYSLKEMHSMLTDSGFDVTGSYTMGVPFELARRALESTHIKTYRADPSGERGTLSKVMDYVRPLRRLYCAVLPYSTLGINIGDSGSGMILVSSKR
ncbi:MAG: class I SAM-dependent methyltransferase, partial [Candidatus Aenigmatarchaeota archaeon]